jgi:hypothetical protein
MKRAGRACTQFENGLTNIWGAEFLDFSGKGAMVSTVGAGRGVGKLMVWELIVESGNRRKEMLTRVL